MSFEGVAIRAEKLSKAYMVFDNPADRLRQFFWGSRRQFGRRFDALTDVSFEVPKGAVLGIVGSNGAGKSTLLQLVCKTLTPSSGSINVHGRVAALLELGAGFSPEFTGRENIYLSAAIQGVSSEDMAAQVEEIIDCSGVRDFIDQPVKTYSSGMYVRLAFAIATSISPDVLVIDEALSVGDGAFARKSFDRIMSLRAQGTTILFCSHAMYHIEAICDQALWLRDGRVEMLDSPARVISDYTTFLDRKAEAPANAPLPVPQEVCQPGCARIAGIEVAVNGRMGREQELHSGLDTLSVRVRFNSDPALPSPSLGIGIISASGITIASAGNFNEGLVLERDAAGRGEGCLVFPGLPLLKGDYYISVFLFCERGIHIYDHAERYAMIRVTQKGLEQGVVALPHHWE